jgi:hypothetical protein
VVVVLFNLLAPVGWKVGLLRIQDVAIGCLVSLVVGVLFWPRGAASVVGDDLADAFHRGAAYLTQAVDWALGSRHVPPDAGAAAVTAGIRLDEALRGFLAEQGAKRLSKEDLWMLVMATTRLRLTAYSLAGLQAPESVRHATHRRMAYVRAALARATADLTGFYGQSGGGGIGPGDHDPASSASAVGAASICSISARTRHAHHRSGLATWPSSDACPGGVRPSPVLRTRAGSPRSAPASSGRRRPGRRAGRARPARRR